MAEINHVEPRETLRRHRDGCDWGAGSRVLARTANGDALLFVVAGHHAPVGARGHGRAYHQAAVWITARKGWSGWPGSERKQLSEGRLDLRKLRAEHGDLIDRVFACQGLSQLLDPKRTVVVLG